MATQDPDPRAADPGPPVAAPSTGGAGADEELYDAYQERLLRGEAPDPDEFLAGVPGANDELRETLRRLYRVAEAARRCAEPHGSGGPLPFERLGDFRLLARIGSGGMGLVFMAEQESLGRAVALKILRPEWSAAPVAAARFRREVQAIARLRHPNIVAVHAAGEERGVRWFAMDLVEGRSLEELLRSEDARGIPRAQKVRWVLEIARALEHAHGQGLVHRDVKPANVRIASDGRALLVDFGLVLEDGADGAPTLTQGFAGSPAYASPEQVRSAADVDARTDVYSLGATLYECLTGRVPHAGKSAQDVLFRIAFEEPVPPRRLDPTIPRDLEIVALHALEKDRARRYASAAELAQDLEAALDLRPIRARPPGAFARASRRARRHPGAAAALLTALLAALGSGVFAGVRARREASERRAEARAAVEQARAGVASYRASFEALSAIEGQVVELRENLEYAYLTPEQDALLASQENASSERRRGRESAFYEVLDLLRHAERLEPRVAGTDEVRGALYFERFREALNTGDDEAARFYRERIEALDPAGASAAALRGDVRATIESDPPGAELYLFRYEELARLHEGGEAREVPVPCGSGGQGRLRGALAAGAEPFEPGTWGLRVVEEAGELQRGDFLVELAGHPIREAVLVLAATPPTQAGDRLVAVDGVQPGGIEVCEALEAAFASAAGEPQGARTYQFTRQAREVGGEVELHERSGSSLAALGIEVGSPAELAALESRSALACSFWRGDALLAASLPPGAAARASAATPVLAGAARAGTTPLTLRLEAGEYLGVLVLAGREEQRIALRVRFGRGELACRVSLLELGTTPRGFVRVVPTGGPFDHVRPYWIQEREVTAAEYLEFLNDPVTLAEIDASRLPTRVPRYGEPRTAAPLWERGTDGRYALPADWRPDWPVLAVSYGDAEGYARWLTERARRTGSHEVYTLPREAELELAGHAGLSRHYAWGSTFWPKWARTCFAKPKAGPGPVLRFPLDESPLGVFDLGGSAFEWVADPWGSDGNTQRLAGGAWGRSDPEMLKIEGGIGAAPDMTTGETGIRLVMRLRGED